MNNNTKVFLKKHFSLKSPIFVYLLQNILIYQRFLDQNDYL